MSEFTETLKRVYAAGKITQAKIDSWLAAGKITQVEHDYILAP